MTQETLLAKRFQLLFRVNATQPATLDTASKTIRYGALEDGPNDSVELLDTQTGVTHYFSVYESNSDEETYELILQYIQDEILSKEAK